MGNMAKSKHQVFTEFGLGEREKSKELFENTEEEEDLNNHNLMTLFPLE